MIDPAEVSIASLEQFGLRECEITILERECGPWLSGLLGMTKAELSGIPYMGRSRVEKVVRAARKAVGR